MSDTQQKQGQTHLLLNIVMVLLETFYSFILKHDRVVRLQAKNFVDQQITVKVNSYIPYFDFYVQFTDKGMLFDLKAPPKEADLIVSSTLVDLLQIYALGNLRSLKKMRIEGDNVLKDQFRDLSLHLSVPKLLSDWKQWLKQSDDQDTTSIASKKRIAPLLEKIDQQRSKINSLQVEVKQYQNRVKRLSRNYTRLNYAFIVTLVLFLCLVVYNLWSFFK